MSDEMVTTANIQLTLIGDRKIGCQITGPEIDYQSPLTPVDIDLAGMSAKIEQLRKVLNAEQTAIWAGLTDPWGSPQGELAIAEFANAVERVVTEGAALYQELCANGFRTVLEKIDDTLKEGDRIRINTDSAFLPWEILYPYEYNQEWPVSKKKAQPLRPKALWGYRFMTSHYLLPSINEGGYQFPITEHKSGPDFISLNLNKEIEDAFGNRAFKPIDFHHQFFNSSLSKRGQLLEDPESIKEDLLAANNNATVIYLYCHGKSTTLFTAEGDELQLATGSVITPAFLDQTKYLRGPIVILNSCSSAATSPLSFTSFLKKFRSKRAMGIIGTTIEIPATFAAAFGRKLIESYLAGNPLGKAVYELRRDLLDRSNPLGMFYSLQCPDYVAAPTQQTESSDKPPADVKE